MPVDVWYIHRCNLGLKRFGLEMVSIRFLKRISLVLVLRVQRLVTVSRGESLGFEAETFYHESGDLIISCNSMSTKLLVSSRFDSLLDLM